LISKVWVVNRLDNLAKPIERRGRTDPSRPALHVEGRTLSYADLADLAGRIAGWIREEVGVPAPRVAVWGRRSLPAHAGLLGAAWAGGSWVPLDPRLPPARLCEVVEEADAHALIADSRDVARCREQLGDVLPRAVLALPAGVRTDDALSGVRPLATPVPMAAGALAYLMFTSGTTGRPKGIAVTVANVAHFLDAIGTRLALTAADRVAHLNALAFDLSIFDLFATWQAGACVYALPDEIRLNPVPFLREHRLTVWLSVPSLVALLDRLRQLAPNSLPTLRTSLFCGEAFPVTLAETWQRAAPHSIVENLYGPTEVTVACAAHRFEGSGDVTPDRGILPIGRPLPGLEAAICDERGAFLGEGEAGELLLSGPQVAAGYWRDEALTRARFPERTGPDGVRRRWYRTGDLARRDASGVLHFLGRADTRTKIRGHLVALEEVEHHLREVTDCPTAVVVPWPVRDGIALGSVGVIDRDDLDAHAVRAALRERLPDYAIPQRLLPVDTLPRGATGKIDRRAIGALVAATLGADGPSGRR